MIHRVRSPEPHGCGIAALAMVMGQTYQEIQQWFQDHDRDIGAAHGGSHVDWDVYLCEHGFAVARKFESWVNRQREPWPPEPWADTFICAKWSSRRTAKRRMRSSCWATAR